MKGMPLLRILLSLAFIALVMWLFPALWGALFVALLVLITVQVILVRRHLASIGNERQAERNLRNLVARFSVAGGGASGGVASGGVAAKPPEGEAEPASPIGAEVFGKFRAHLEAAEQESETAGPPQKEPPPPEPAPRAAGFAAPPPEKEPPEPKAAAKPETATEPKPRSAPSEGDGVTVRLSSAAKRKGRTRKAGPAVQEPGQEEDLFADLRPKPLPAEEAQPDPKAKPPARSRAAQKGASTASPVEDAIGAALHDETPSQPAPDQGGLLLKLAEEALDRGDRAGAQAGIEQMLGLGAEASPDVPWHIKLLQAKMALLDRDFPLAQAGFEAVLHLNPALREADYPPLIDRLIRPLTGAEAEGQRAALLMKVVAHYRQAGDRAAVDRLYGLIEAAQELAKDEAKLIQYLKNHLEIRKVLEDVDGQLELIDRIGNRYYKLGDTQTARQYYEDGLKLRAEQAPAGDTAKTASDSSDTPETPPV